MTSTATALHGQLFAQARTPRSDAYQFGALNALRHHLGEGNGAGACPFAAGSAEFDAYYAGWLEGRATATQAVRNVLDAVSA